MKPISSNPRLSFIDTLADCLWLRETHLKQSNLPPGYVLPNYQSALIRGNEDCPEMITLYASPAPLITDNSLAALVYDRENDGYKPRVSRSEYQAEQDREREQLAAMERSVSHSSGADQGD